MCGWLFTVGAFTLCFLPSGWRETGLARPGRGGAFMAVAVLFMLAAYANGSFQHALLDWRQAAPAFNTYIQQRYALIAEAHQQAQRRLIVPAFEGKYPRSLYFNDILPLSLDWRNVCYARYFGLEQIKRQRGQTKPRQSDMRPPSPAWTQTSPAEAP
ncbi:MAG: hypothetical protein HZT40_11575 [Candidatus Thiothrix singaporensis]|uniref:Uncharacterized protein n=1 Tax=Candidatus Thiothrix singaporensis TaxID=2799669 RepID=A0A7L6ASN2_9GAMM|nr:MAG: hypothetical protein HZT40_11575 [Candidatus Thiothrix singaporensis]